MKKWNNPELTKLGVENTKDTRDFPHYWACNGCGKHYVGVSGGILPPKGACKRCGSTDGYKWTAGDGDIVTQPNFNGPAVDQIVPEIS